LYLAISDPISKYVCDSLHDVAFTPNFGTIPFNSRREMSL
jgi:hypothetical protein